MNVLQHVFQIALISFHVVVFFSSASTFADEVEGNVILALEPQQGRVVVKTATEALQVLQVGDVFPGSLVTIKQVLADRVVAEEIIDSDNPVVQQLWIYKSENPNQSSRVERFLLESPEKKGIAVPNQISQDIYFPAPNLRSEDQ